MKILYFFVGIIVLPQISYCQNFYDRDFSSSGNKVKERKVVPWPYLKESDVFIVKYVERIIDVREKQNQPMAYPPNPLATILYNAVLAGKLVPFQNDSLNRAISLSKFISIGNDTEVLSIPVDPDDPSYTIDTSIVNPFVPIDRIKKYRIVELWLFDKTRSQYSVRIVSIAPQYELKMGGVNLGWQDLCVLKYYSKDELDIRHVCINHDVFNRQNNQVELSYDDWFEQRLFK